MNNQELLNALKQVATFVFALFVAKGYLTADQSTTLITNFAIIVPAFGAIGSVVWSIYSHWNMKKVPENSTAVTGLGAPPVGATVNLAPLNGLAKVVGCLLVCLLTTSAFAADVSPPIVTKAPPAVSPFVNYGSGWYWGVGTYAGVAQSSVSGTNLLATGLATSNIEAAGGGVDVAIGYMKGSTANLGFGNWYRFEAEAAYQNIQGAVSVPGDTAGVQSHWSATQEADIGADVIAAIMAKVGSLGLTIPAFQPALPANIAVAATPKQYFGVVLREFQMNGNFGKANGEMWGVAPGIKSGFIYRTVDSNGNPNGGGIDLWASVTWNTKGMTFNNVFAGNGAPITVGPGANMGTTYLAGIRADFGM